MPKITPAKKVQLHLLITEEEERILAAAAAKRGLTKTALVRQLIHGLKP